MQPNLLFVNLRDSLMARGDFRGVSFEMGATEEVVSRMYQHASSRLTRSDASLEDSRIRLFEIKTLEIR